MKTAQDIMTTDVITFTPDTEISEAARTLLEHHINGAPVIKDGKVVGILCQSDLVAQQKKLNLPSVFTILDGFVAIGSLGKMEKEMQRISALNVGQAMTERVISVSPDTPLDEVAAIMVDQKLHTLPVVRDHVLVGIIGKEDVLRTLVGANT